MLAHLGIEESISEAETEIGSDTVIKDPPENRAIKFEVPDINQAEADGKDAEEKKRRFSRSCWRRPPVPNPDPHHCALKRRLAPERNYNTEKNLLTLLDAQIAPRRLATALLLNRQPCLVGLSMKN
jgi:hypothetical protein